MATRRVERPGRASAVYSSTRRRRGGVEHSSASAQLGQAVQRLGSVKLCSGWASRCEALAWRGRALRSATKLSDGMAGLCPARLRRGRARRAVAKRRLGEARRPRAERRRGATRRRPAKRRQGHARRLNALAKQSSIFEGTGCGRAPSTVARAPLRPARHGRPARRHGRALHGNGIGQPRAERPSDGEAWRHNAGPSQAMQPSIFEGD